MKSVTLRAYAKINLSLDVVGKREDGYHLLRSVFQGISLYDNVKVTREEGAGGITIRCNLPYIPTDERNIVHKVATAFFKAAGIDRYQITIEMEKFIPTGAGLGGGSADGAAVFSALCRLYDHPVPIARAIELLTPIGADIPFFLYSGTMLAEGVGEILTPAPPMPDCRIVLAKPRASASTKEIFGMLNKVGIPSHPNTEDVLAALEQKDLRALAAATGNVLENATIPLCPRIGILKEQLAKHGAILSMMTGSGSTVFGIFDNEKSARRAIQALKAQNETVFPAYPVCRPMRTE